MNKELIQSFVIENLFDRRLDVEIMQVCTKGQMQNTWNCIENLDYGTAIVSSFRVEHRQSLFYGLFCHEKYRLLFTLFSANSWNSEDNLLSVIIPIQWRAKSTKFPYK